jgi:hypothetical protein
MNRPTPPAALSADRMPDAAPDPARSRSRPLLRRYEALCLGEDGNELEINRLAPASAFFEAAFNALARGTLIATPDGPVAIEDLRPGDYVDTAEGGPEPVLWRGNLTLYPLRPGGAGRPDRLYRVTGDALGYGRPMQDLLLGPGARIWSSRQGDFLPPEALVDGDTVVELSPPAAVSAYHLCLAGRRTLLANGVAFRSFTPDVAAAGHIAPDLLALFVALFPNADMISDFAALPLPRRPLPPGHRVAVA